MSDWRIWSEPGSYAVTLNEAFAESWWNRTMLGLHQLVSGTFQDGEFTVLAGLRRDQLVRLTRVDDGSDFPPEGEFTTIAIETRQWAITDRTAVSRETPTIT